MVLLTVLFAGWFGVGKKIRFIRPYLLHARETVEVWDVPDSDLKSDVVALGPHMQGILVVEPGLQRVDLCRMCFDDELDVLVVVGTLGVRPVDLVGVHVLLDLGCQWLVVDFSVSRIGVSTASRASVRVNKLRDIEWKRIAWNLI